MGRFVGEVGRGYAVQIIPSASGTFKFWIEDAGTARSAAGTVQIPPKLELHDRAHCTMAISPDSIVVQTLVSKWMGPLSAWRPHLVAASHAGYNMIHFTPLQRRGTSNSPYSIYDHHEIDPHLFPPHTEPHTRRDQLQLQIDAMDRELGLLSMIDVVWNHTACDSPWLAAQPDAGYNLQNSPHLKLAYELDEAILAFSAMLEHEGEHQVSADPRDEADVRVILDFFLGSMLPKLALWEFFVVNVAHALADLEGAFRKEAALRPAGGDDAAATTPHRLGDALYFDGSYARNAYRMNLRAVTQIYRSKISEYRGMRSERERGLLLARVLDDYKRELDEINSARYRVYDEKVAQITKNLHNRMVYERVAEHGPRIGPITASSPLVPTYFTRVRCADGTLLVFANNGWIWDADPLLNFADPHSDVYFTRDVIIWGDCVKLRYGAAPADSPWLWEYMEEYTRDMARTFHGFRIDNCHSTPLHVAEHLLSQARAIRPELYVCAELFTGSEEKDMLFAARLGLNALIREAMAAWDVAELGRTMCSYGGQPVGCPFQRAEHLPRRFGRVETIMHSTLPALLMDCTHDNETPYERRTALDYLPNAAIVAMSSSAIGSVRGYDELVAKHLDLVTEARLYPPPNLSTGLWAVRRRLNEMHQMILAEGLCEILVRCDQDVMMIERVNPETMASLVLVARTAFGPVHFLHAPEPVVFAGYRVKHRFSAKLTILGDSAEDPAGFIPGIRAEVECSDEEGTAGGETGTRYEIEEGSGGATLRLLEFLPGSILVLAKEPLFQIPRITLQDPAWSAVAERVGSMDLDELNVLLYRCAAEENDGAVPFGVYNLPGYGPLSYSGLQGFYSVLKRLMLNPTPDHPLFENLRAGDWAPRYSSDRLVRDECPRLALLSADIHRLLAEINEMPAWARPRLYIKLLGELYQAAVSAAISRMPRAIVEGSIMVQRLALGSVQLVGRVSSAGLHPSACEPSLSAGLPHFSTHHMRCWGRDVFISLPGLLLKTGRFADCRRHLLAFASCFFRGLIPNLLDSGRRPRFNARDATWWFLHALQAYCREAPGGAEILEAEVALRFGGGEYVDFDDPGIFTQTKRLKEIVQDIMEAHASGIKFREWNAGPELDGVMQDEGFNIEIYTDERTGFIHGGNVHNCGTWMDKMGESTLGGNRGVPATPRDGAAIEITALLFSALEWLEKDCPTGRSTVGLAGTEGCWWPLSM